MVPMNHSNKHRTSLAESEEGRLRIERILSHSTRTRHRAGLSLSHGWASVQTSVRLAAIASEIRTDALMSARPGLWGAPGNWCPYCDHNHCGRAIYRTAVSVRSPLRGQFFGILEVNRTLLK